MSRRRGAREGSHSLGLLAEEEAALGADTAVRLRTFRLVLIVASALRAVMDRVLADDDLTTQQAALLTVAKSLRAPSFSECAKALVMSHQNVKQLALPLERKGFLKIVVDPEDGRIRRLVTTSKNDRYWATRNGADHAIVLRAFERLSASEARALFRLLLKARVGVTALDSDREAQPLEPQKGPRRRASRPVASTRRPATGSRRGSN